MYVDTAFLKLFVRYLQSDRVDLTGQWLPYCATSPSRQTLFKYSSSSVVELWAATSKRERPGGGHATLASYIVDSTPLAS